MNRRRLIAWIATAVTSMMLVIGSQFVNLSPANSTTTLNVFAASSLTNAMNDIKTQYQSANPSVNVVYTFGASGTLLSQIQAGAAADIFISAATDQIDVLQNATPSKLVAGSRKNVVKNRLVLIAPTTPPVSAGSAALTSFNGLTNANITGIAIGDYTGTPPVVPAGNYAKQVLTSRGIFTTVSPKTYLASNVRNVLTAVENKTLVVGGVSKTIDAGAVYKTDAAISTKVRVVETALTTESDPIVYPLGILANTTVLSTAQSFSTYLSGTTAQNIFKNTYGFILP
ncbi:molybdate ABC transporter substrate-binding protein [Nostoc sp. 'Peltigera membranacea cyanobiont' 213]|uniref:molybdate ABC transporter substrate-binding protein n=1 Tax=unclassified Nostoc TaxID=2593658 RepID=UPI000B954B62|nr:MULTISPECIES: molybdate ABC transporter substrate-binding protein [unclassified Nostoc]AVH62836.1 molybdate ABC transporter substrate-binding protein [Nostoc sp. 'Peltigera membranacea cyanobiont' N6]OYD89020.1 molybdate ABC transporter substrate-binding protein [Nostoc sp. 'Peltigera membranacea cyanobiont' 213]